MAGIRSAEEIAFDVLDAYRLGEFLKSKLTQAIREAQAEALEWAADEIEHGGVCLGDRCDNCEDVEVLRAEAQRIREGR